MLEIVNIFIWLKLIVLKLILMFPLKIASHLSAQIHAGFLRSESSISAARKGFAH